MRRFLFSLMILSGFSANAQDPHFSQFFASPLTLNPAFAGKFNGNWRLSANHRDQWPTIPKAYVTTSAALDFGILKNKITNGDVLGIGLSGITDASANNQLKMNYGSATLAYHKALDADGYNTIGAGFQGTYSSINLDVSKLTFADMLTANGFTGTTSETFTNGTNQSYFDVNAGVLYSGSTNGENNFYVGASLYHINRPKVNFQDQSWYLRGRMTVHAGATLPINDIFSVSTSAIYQQQANASEIVAGAAVGVNAGNDLENPTIVSAGLWLRAGDALIPYIGLEFKGLRIGASYDVNVSNLKAATASRGGSEFSLIYTHQKNVDYRIPCPKF